MVSVVRDLGVALLCSFASGLQLRCWPVLQSAQGWVGGESASRFTHMPVVRPRLGPHWLLQRHYFLAGGFLHKESLRRNSQSFCNNLRGNPIFSFLEVSPEVQPTLKGRGMTQEHEYQEERMGRGERGISEAAYHTHFQNSKLI